MNEIGKKVVNKVKMKLAKLIIEQHVYDSYACKVCNAENIETPVVTPREPA